MSIRKHRTPPPPVEPVAGNGLLHRRALLRGGAMVAGAMTTGASLTGAAAEPLQNDPWSLEMGSVVPAYQVPSRFEKDVVRTRSNPDNEFRNSHARTPHHLLQGTVTPNGLFFSISHSGLPDIDPAQHKLVIHGLVKQPLVYTVESLSRYPMVTRMHFLECSGNSAPMFSSEPLQVTAQAIHGLVSNAEWTGVLLSTLLEETGIDPKAKWLFAEGADSLALHRSVPIKKALDDAMIALYQNGERIQPGNGYPMRLLLPGYQGNMNVKHVRRIKLIDQPAMSFFESKTYSQILPGGKMWLFHFTQEVKIVHHPSLLRPRAEGDGLLRDFRPRLFGQRTHLQGDGLGRRRQELGTGGAAGAGAAEGVHALPHAVALGWPAGHPAEPCLGRGRQRSAVAGRVRRRARPDR
jgi:sulfane dehydrogenase subunit SoxC